MSSTQKALLLPKKHGEFIVQDIPITKVQKGHVLVKVLSAALNPVDWKIQKLGFNFTVYPMIVGYDFAGEVVEVSEEVNDFTVGEKVFGQTPMEPLSGTFQQYISVSASLTTKVPSNITLDEAATIPVGLTCVYVGLYNEEPHGFGFVPPVGGGRGKYSGVPLLVVGGSSAVGQQVLQLARLSGFSPIITTASVRNADALKSLGATVIIDRTLENSALVAEVKKHTGGKPLQYVYDAISLEETQKLSLDILAAGGKLVLTLGPLVTATAQKKILNPFGAIAQEYNAHLLKPLYHDYLFGLVEKGDIKPNKVEVLPGGLAGIPAGLAKLEADKVSGTKLVAHPQE